MSTSQSIKNPNVSTLGAVNSIIPQRRSVIGLVEAGDSLVFVLISIEDGD